MGGSIAPIHQESHVSDILIRRSSRALPRMILLDSRRPPDVLYCPNTVTSSAFAIAVAKWIASEATPHIVHKRNRRGRHSVSLPALAPERMAKALRSGAST